jgi:hypothetical protein
MAVLLQVWFRDSHRNWSQIIQQRRGWRIQVLIKDNRAHFVQEGISHAAHHADLSLNVHAFGWPRVITCDFVVMDEKSAMIGASAGVK